MWWYFAMALASSEPLTDPDPAVRAAAAEARREAGLPDTGSTWSARIEGLTEGHALDAALAALPTIEPGPSLRSGGTEIRTWRLDDQWVLVVPVAGDMLAGTPELRQDVREFWVDPPAGYTGVWRTYRANGHLAHEIHFAGGTYHGAFRSFHDNGQVAVEQRYVQGTVEGADAGWHRNGQPAYTGAHVGGRRTGAWEHWTADGMRVRHETYVDGALDGVQRTWWDTGEPMSEVSWSAGRRHGVERRWDEAGRLLWERRYRGGDLIE